MDKFVDVLVWIFIVCMVGYFGSCVGIIVITIWKEKQDDICRNNLESDSSGRSGIHHGDFLRDVHDGNDGKGDRE